MLRDDQELELLSTAFEPGIRSADRESYSIDNVVQAFFSDKDVRGSTVMELGPGHYELLGQLALLGASGEAVEYDPAVAKLGEKRGFVVYQQDLTQLDVAKLNGPYDGVFCRGAIDAFWFYDSPTSMSDYIEKLVSLGKPDAWFWIAPCADRPAECSDEEFAQVLNAQDDLYRKHGFTIFSPTSRFVRSWFGIQGSSTAQRIFYKNLSSPRLSIRDVGRLFKFAAWHGSRAWKRSGITRSSR